MKTSISQIWIVCHLLPFAKLWQNSPCDNFSVHNDLGHLAMLGLAPIRISDLAGYTLVLKHNNFSRVYT